MAHVGTRGYPYIFRRDLSIMRDYRSKLGRKYFILTSFLFTNFSKATWPFYWVSEDAEVDEAAGTVTYNWLTPPGALNNPQAWFKYSLTFANPQTRFQANIALNGVWGTPGDQTILRDLLGTMGTGDSAFPNVTTGGKFCQWPGGTCDAAYWSFF